MGKELSIYTAGSISGLSYEQVMERYNGQESRLKSIGYKVFVPLVCKGYLKGETKLKPHGYEDFPMSTNKAIKTRDRWMVGKVDVLLADFSQSGDIVSIGTCMELAWADELKKHTVVVLPEGNIHKHAFVLECASIIFDNIEEAYEYLEELNA